MELPKGDDGSCELTCDGATSYRAFAQAISSKYRSAWSTAVESTCSASIEVIDG